MTDENDHQPLTQALLSELDVIQEKDHVRVVDLVLVNEASDGKVSMQELSELDDGASPVCSGIAEDLIGLLTKEDIEQLTRKTPNGTSAYVILLEHAWVTDLTEAVRRWVDWSSPAAWSFMKQ